MKLKTSQILYSYWNEVRGERIAPRRFDIEPARIGGIVPETFILEQVDRQTYRFRLAGTRICEQFGAEFRGLNVLDLVEGEDRGTLERLLLELAAQGGVGVLTLEAEASTGRTARFEVVLLPLVHTRTSIDRFLGSISAVDGPAWLGTERLGRTRLLAHEMIWPDGRPHALVQRFHNQTPFLPVMANARIVRQDRRQFRVFDGGLAKDTEPRQG